MKNIFNSLSVQIIIYLSCLCPPFLSYISYLSLQVRLPALPVSFLCCLTYHTFLYRYVYLPCRCPSFLSYISYLSLRVRLPALPVSTFFVLHIIPFSTGTSTCLAGVHLFCPTFNTFLCRYVYLPCRCPPFFTYISYLSLQDSQPLSYMFIYLINF